MNVVVLRQVGGFELLQAHGIEAPKELGDSPVTLLILIARDREGHYSHFRDKIVILRNHGRTALNFLFLKELKRHTGANGPRRLTSTNSVNSGDLLKVVFQLIPEKEQFLGHGWRRNQCGGT